MRPLAARHFSGCQGRIPGPEKRVSVAPKIAAGLAIEDFGSRILDLGIEIVPAMPWGGEANIVRT